MIEVWKELPGNRETYEVSNFGNVRTKNRLGSRGGIVVGHTLKQHCNSNGYMRVKMSICGKSKDYLVHRLVASLFLEQVDGKDFVNHIDGDKRNNHVANLEWCTKSENELHAHRIGIKRANNVLRGEESFFHKLKKEDVDYIRRVHKPYDKEFGTNPLARKFGVNPQTITELIHGRTWKSCTTST